MKEITLTINGRQVKGREGATVLQVCEANGIYVPTLCHLSGLSDVGACRMCVVDIEKERRPVPACTYPARDGLVVQTHNEKLEKHRLLILELMFTERNHLCAQCVASGDCELQSLAYEYQMDNVRYPYSWPALPLDSVNDYLVIDHNRCILCGRCIRTCDELVGVHTLDFGHRGWKDAVIADLNQPLGASSCISCGACFQVCPTGAIFSKDSAYKARPDAGREIDSVCPICGIGCETRVLVKDNRLVRIDSPDLSARRGILCHKGRFAPLQKDGQRVTTSLVRDNRGRPKARPLAEAIDIVAQRLAQLKTQYGSNSIAGIASSQASNDSLRAFKEFIIGTIGSELIDTLDGDVYRTIARGIHDYDHDGGLEIEGSLEDILKADCIIVAGANPLESHPVAGSYIARAARHNGASLIVIDPSQNAFPYHARLWLRPRKGKELPALQVLSKAITDKGGKKGSARAQEMAAALKDITVQRAAKEAGIDIRDVMAAADMLRAARHSIIIYGDGILRQRNPALVTALLNLAAAPSGQGQGKARVISLKPKGNSRGAWDLGMAGLSQPIMDNLTGNNIKALYILLGDDHVSPSQLASLGKGLEFIVIQSSHLPPARTKADVILPSAGWAEVRAKHTTLDGLSRSTTRLVKPPTGVKTDWEILGELTDRIKKQHSR